METPPTVAIFRMKLLPPSEVFIREQCEALRRFRAFYVGWRRVPGSLELPAERVAILRRTFLYRLTRRGQLADAPLRAAGAQMIHAQFEEGGIEALPLARSLGIPLAVTFRGYDVTVDDAFLRPRLLQRELYRQRRHRLQRKGQLFLGVSAFIRRKMIERGYPAERSIVHYNGVNLARFRPPVQPQRRPIVLFVGRLVEKKGCEFVLRAAAEVQASVPQIEVVIIGDGPLRESLEMLARPLLRRVTFLSGLSSDEVRNWMEIARVFSIGSITAANGDSEGLPNVVVEAMACGLPVVSFDHAGISEAVLHGRTGFLAPERAALDLAKSYATLLQDEACWDEFSRAGRAHVEVTFDQAKQTPRLEAIYENLIQEAAR